jgi:hypothetical protein
MLVNVTIKMIEGALASVHTYIYSNGKSVVRVVDLHTGIPIRILE